MVVETNFTIIRGLPFRREIRIEGGKNVWSGLSDFEVRAQLRKKKAMDSELICDLHTFMTKAYGVDTQVDDIIITWSMTGSETLSALTAKGYYDVIVSDSGSTDARAIEALSGVIALDGITTAPED